MKFNKFLNILKTTHFGHIFLLSTWPHLLATCHNHVIKGLRMDKHNKALTYIQKMLLTHHLSKWKCITNGSLTPTNSFEHMVPRWILSHHLHMPPFPLTHVIVPPNSIHISSSSKASPPMHLHPIKQYGLH